MPRKILEIYDEYKIMPQLKEHMLRVAAVATLICDNFTEVLPKEDIITACLLHDMGNIIKSDLTVFTPEFYAPQGVEYWQKVKEEYIKKYGVNEYDANARILNELGLSTSIISLADQLDFSQICKYKDGEDFNKKIVEYSDVRVDPHGVVSYEERLAEARRRYKDRFPFDQKLIACGKKIEKQIFAKCKIKPEDINNESVRPVILTLRDFMIK